MQDIVRVLESIKSDALAGRLDYGNLGICTEVQWRLFPCTKRQKQQLRRAMKSWEYYSGSPTYPIGGHTEFLTMYLWRSRSFEARLLMLDHLIELADEGFFEDYV